MVQEHKMEKTEKRNRLDMEERLSFNIIVLVYSLLLTEEDSATTISFVNIYKCQQILDTYMLLFSIKKK